MRETPKAREACHRYLTMGPERSLPKLARLLVAEESQLREGTENWQRACDTRERNLSEWSRVHGWVARAEEFDEDANARRRARYHKELEEQDAHTWKMVRAALGLRGREVSKEDPSLVRSMQDVSTATKLLHDLAGEPFTEKHEHKHSGSVEVATFLDSLNADQRKQFAELSRAVGNGDAEQADEDAV